MISIPAAVVASVVGSAALASWLVICRRALGPQALGSSMAACAVAAVLLEVAGRTTAAVTSSANSAVALLLVVVPIFGFAFWSGGVLVRALAADPTGSGGRRP
jgi:hypothetical protein